MAEAGPKRDVVLVWLASGIKATLADFARGESCADLDSAIVRARDFMPSGMLPWICCDKKFVLSPEDVFMAYNQLKEKGQCPRLLEKGSLMKGAKGEKRPADATGNAVKAMRIEGEGLRQAGLTDRVWDLSDVAAIMAEIAPKPGRPKTYKRRAAA